MNYVRVKHNGIARWGVVVGDEIFALSAAPYHQPQQGERLTTLAQAEWLAPATPSKLLAVGRNYIKHIEEMAACMSANANLPPRPDHPTFFIKANSAIIGHNTPIVYPTGVSKHVEHEAELGLVIGRRTRHVTEADALSYVFGYVCGNDVSARDLRDDGQWMRGKSFDSFAPLGPYLVTDIDAADLRIQARVNGVTKQDSRTSDLLFKLPHLIAFISQAMTLEAGDVIITGTPSGVSAIQPGDVVEIEIEGLGVLRNPVVGV